MGSIEIVTLVPLRITEVIRSSEAVHTVDPPKPLELPTGLDPFSRSVVSYFTAFARFENRTIALKQAYDKAAFEHKDTEPLILDEIKPMVPISMQTKERAIDVFPATERVVFGRPTNKARPTNLIPIPAMG